MQQESDDQALIAQISEGSEVAMTRFYKAHESRIYAFALKKVNDPHASADIVIETMMAVWTGAGSYKGTAKVSTWLFGIAHRKSIDVLRKRGRQETDELDFDIEDESSDFSLALEAIEDGAQLHQCIKALPAAQQEIVHLAFFEDLSYPEISAITDCAEGTIKSRIFHAKSKLKQCVERLMRG
ncbi:MAG: RNA polymerase sigma-70 factor (ECF subfamily) [Parasphingorhabdus sp.]|jgi:RNA polymerase sigma-70 factor (ECF subfamily)